MDSLSIATYGLGFVVVFFFSLKEFNAPRYYYSSENDDLVNLAPYAKLARPALPKYMADPTSYAVSMLVFAVIAGLIYYWFACIISNLPLISEKPWENFFSALVSASLMVGIAKAEDIPFEKAKFLAKLPKKLVFGLVKDWLHSNVFIPRLGQEVFHILCFAEINYGSERVEANLKLLLDAGEKKGAVPGRHLDRSDFATPGNSRTMTTRWARLSYFMLIVDQWRQDDRFKSHIREQSLGCLHLKNAYNLNFACFIC